MKKLEKTWVKQSGAESQTKTTDEVKKTEKYSR